MTDKRQVWLVKRGYFSPQATVSVFTDRDAAVRFVDEQNAKSRAVAPVDEGRIVYRVDDWPTEVAEGAETTLLEDDVERFKRLSPVEPPWPEV